VKYFDVESEYTPKDMQTAANKNRESVSQAAASGKLPAEAGQEAELN
jgi:hypothetical protein